MALNKMQYDSIIKRYEQTRDHNRHLSEERREHVYRHIPGYRELDESIAKTSVSFTKAVIDGEEDAMQKVRASLRDISARKQSLLTDNGYPANYLEPVFDCTDCEDTGFITDTNGLKTKCHCFRSQEIELLYDQSNIREIIGTENFTTLSYGYYQGEDLTRFQKAVNICKDFVQNFEHDYHNLFFYGTVGTGKSFLSGCVACELLKKGCSVIYFSASRLFETLAQYSFDNHSKEALYDFYNDLYNCDLVIIDDLGTELTNAFVSSQLFSCLNERHLRRHATIISTNLSLEELRDRYSDRVFSRITSNYELCKLTGPDIRMFKKRSANSLNS
uniref:ATP-binding protein n=1 Tax=Acetatifactor sp. TaxID=1872090 RepID=UPI004055C3A1